MDGRTITRRRAPTATSMSSDLSEEPIIEADEPPDEPRSFFQWSSSNVPSAGYIKAPPRAPRRESLLTRQLHSETEHTDHDEPRSPTHIQNQRNTWGSMSMASTAELTSDDGHSVPSTAGSPPLPPTRAYNDVAVVEPHVKIVGQDVSPTGLAKEASPEQQVEANLGRKRCITFACKGKQDAKPAEPAVEQTKTESSSPPKRKCMLKFVCPSRAEADKKVVETIAEPVEVKRLRSPPPPVRKSTPIAKHRDSDSTVTLPSPQQVRKISVVDNNISDTSRIDIPKRERRYSNDSNDDSGDEGTRFHEFGTEDEHEAWTQVATCYRNRLTVDDTLKKELVIRKACEEAHEEALEEEEAEDEEVDEELDELAADAEIDDEDDVDLDGIDEDDDTDDGFHSDDEEGFADSDSEDDGSDFEWWKPGGVSTAATSVDQLDRLAHVSSQQTLPGTSAGSVSSGHISPYTSRTNLRKISSRQGRRTAAVMIHRPASPELPDSTDFVCGTLDEDRPLEQALVNRRKEKLAAKKGLRPQDIDPTFPTSEPESSDDDEEDDDEDEALEIGGSGTLQKRDDINGDGTARRRSSALPKATARSPPPAITRCRSPPPSKQRVAYHSPPPPTKRGMAKSPAPPRKLFGHSPDRTKSPATVTRMTSPPNSPTESSSKRFIALPGLGGRPQPTHTSSLPRGGGMTITKLATIPSEGEDSENQATEIPKRGAVDIVKGLEKKRQFRKRKLAQKMNAKAANKPEKTYKVKPGTGAERMREVGLALQEYHGKAEHILSL